SCRASAASATIRRSLRPKRIWGPAPMCCWTWGGFGREQEGECVEALAKCRYAWRKRYGIIGGHRFGDQLSEPRHMLRPHAPAHDLCAAESKSVHVTIDRRFRQANAAAEDIGFAQFH